MPVFLSSFILLSANHKSPKTLLLSSLSRQSRHMHDRFKTMHFYQNIFTGKIHTECTAAPINKNSQKRI